MSQDLVLSRILASAFACCPPGRPGFSGGEDVLGWNLVLQIARFNPVWAITHAEHRLSIEQELEEEPVPNLHFVYVKLPEIAQSLLKIQGGHQIYYFVWQVAAYFTARRLHKTINFSLFHHITYANDWMASYIGAFLPVPYVRGPGGGAHRTPKEMQSEYSAKGRFWEKIRGAGQRLFRFDPVFGRGQRRAKAIMVCNRESLESVPRSFRDKVSIFPVNGISSEDLSITAPRERGQQKFRVISAGSLIRVKGFSLAIRGFLIFAAEHPESELSIVGSGPEDSHLKAIIKEFKAGDRVHMIPAVPRNELLKMMGDCDVFLFPSLRDGGGAVVVEAMSAGTPVICLDCGGPAMHIDSKVGIKIKPVSSQKAVGDIASALERLYSEPELRKSLGEAAREHVTREYHWDRLGERLMEIYEPLLSASSASTVSKNQAP